MIDIRAQDLVINGIDFGISDYWPIRDASSADGDARLHNARLQNYQPCGAKARHRPDRKDYIMKITDLTISPKSLGDKLWLVDVSPAYEYKDGKRTDTVLGYRYSIALPEKGLDKIDVKIDGQQQVEAPDGYAEVRFDALEVFVYWSKGDYHVGAKATGIHLVNAKA